MSLRYYWCSVSFHTVILLKCLPSIFTKQRSLEHFLLMIFWRAVSHDWFALNHCFQWRKVSFKTLIRIRLIYRWNIACILTHCWWFLGLDLRLHLAHVNTRRIVDYVSIFIQALLARNFWDHIYNTDRKRKLILCFICTRLLLQLLICFANDTLKWVNFINDICVLRVVIALHFTEILQARLSAD